MVNISERRSNQKVEVDWNIYYQKYLQGLTLKDIGNEIKCSLVCVNIDLNKHNHNPNNLVLLPLDYHKSLHYKIELQNNPDRIYWGINQKQERRTD